MHTLIQNGDGHFCSVCKRSWDRDEAAPLLCETEPQNNWAPSLIGFAGAKGAGKDTAADVFVEHASYVKLRMADGLKTMLRALMAFRGMIPSQIERHIEGDLKEAPCIALNGKSARHAMQTLGTEWGRTLMHPDLWTSALRDQIAMHRNVVISDVRFPNEADMIHSLGGKVYCIMREGPQALDMHASEAGLSGKHIDDLIINNGRSVSDFRTKVLRAITISTTEQNIN